MKNLIYFLTVSVLILLATQIYSQEIDFLRKNVEINFPEKIQGPQGNPLLAGTYTIGTSGNFPTINSAFNKLSNDGVEGAVIFELIDELYTASSDTFGFLLDGPIPGSGPGSRVTIKPALNKNVTIEGKGEAVLNFRNISYITVDGISLKGSTSLKIHSDQNLNCPWNDGISFLNNSKHNVVQNVIIECEDYTRSAGGIVFIHQSGNFTPDSNLAQNNFVKKAAIGISVISFFYWATGNTIRGNIIGSETDSLISLGINVVLGKYTVVENNIVHNVRYNPALFYNPGIVSVAGIGDVIRNNVVHNVNVDSGDYGGIGILLNGTASYSGVNNEVYNNMIYDIQSTSPEASARVSGIEMRYQSYAKVYFNSVYLSGTGSNPQGSAALYIGNNCSHVYVNNNMLVNTRDESPYCASAIYDYDASIYSSDYNDLYYDETNQFNCLVRTGDTNYRTLPDWQTMNNDLHSYSEMPHFVEPYLHIDTSFSTSLNAGGINIEGINSDFDKDTRNSTSPDIGADEFDGIASGVEEEALPTEFALEQNYPNPFNPTTTIKYQISELNFVTLKVYDVLGSEVATLIKEEKPAGSYEVQFDATSLSSGAYFYRLQVYAPGRAGDPSTGSRQGFVETKKMILLK